MVRNGMHNCWLDQPIAAAVVEVVAEAQDKSMVVVGGSDIVVVVDMVPFDVEHDVGNPYSPSNVHKISKISNNSLSQNFFFTNTAGI